MSRIVTSSCKHCRRENQKLFLKGTRCFTDKCAFERRPYPPGQHGQKRMKFSEYALQLREKQKTKRYYGVFENQFRRLFHDADREKGETGYNLLKMLEMRLDSVVYSLGFGLSRREAKHLVRHGHFLVNGKKSTIPSTVLNKLDVVEVKEKSRQMNKILASVENAKSRQLPSWLEADYEHFKGTVKDLPSREDITLPIEENMIVEYYSR